MILFTKAADIDNAYEHPEKKLWSMVIHRALLDIEYYPPRIERFIRSSEKDYIEKYERNIPIEVLHRRTLNKYKDYLMAVDYIFDITPTPMEHSIITHLDWLFPDGAKKVHDIIKQQSKNTIKENSTVYMLVKYFFGGVIDE